MEPTDQSSSPVPPNCFEQEDLEHLQGFESLMLTDVNYYFWLNHHEGAESTLRFLYAVELLFDDAPALILSAREDSEALELIEPKKLVDMAVKLREVNNAITIQRTSAGNFPLWQPAIGKVLEAIRLSKAENDLYLNDAVLLDFNTHAVLVRLAETEGLVVEWYA